MKTLKKIFNFLETDEQLIEKYLYEIRQLTTAKFMATINYAKEQQVVLQFLKEKDLHEFENNPKVSAMVERLLVRPVDH